MAILAVYGLWQVFRWGGREHQVLIGDLAFLPVDGYAALLGWRVSRRADLGRRTCRAWRLIFLAALCFVVGDLLRFLCEVVLHTNGEPAWVQSIYAGCYVFTTCGLIAFPARRRSGPERVRLLLDTGTVFLGGAVLIWYVALGPVLAPGTRFAPADLIAFADTAGDMLVLFGVLLVLSRGTTHSSTTALRIFAAGALRDYGRLADRYQELAAIDGMTGLYNRRHFMETAEAAFAHAQWVGQPFVALMIDVDNFKLINDTHGHIVGDRVLTELAHTCRVHVRPGDIVGRTGRHRARDRRTGSASGSAGQRRVTRPGAHGLTKK